MNSALPPGLAGFVAGQHENDQRGLADIQKATALQGLFAHIQEQQSKNQLRQLLQETGGDVEKALQAAVQTGNLGAAHQLTPLVKLARDHALNQEFSSTQGDGNTSPERLDALAARLAAAGHPGAAAVQAQAEKRRKAIADAETLRTMQSRPEVPAATGYGGAGDVAEQAAQPAQPGLFSSLMQSPHGDIAQQAKTLQTQMNSSNARSTPPQFWQARQEALAKQHEMLANRVEQPVQTITTQDGTVMERQRGGNWRPALGPDGKPIIGKTAGMASDMIIPPEHADKHGADFIATLNPGEREVVKGIAEYRINPASLSTRGGHRERILALAAQANPEYQQQEFAARNGVMRDFTSGVAARNVTSINTAIGHMGTMSTLADAMKTGNVQAVNSVVNAVRTQFGDPAINNYQTAAQAVGEELMRTFRQVGASEVEAAKWESRFKAAQTPQQLQDVIKVGAELLQSRIGALDDQWKRGMKTDKGYPNLLSPKSQAMMQKFGSTASNSGPLTPAEQQELEALRKRMAPNGR